MNSKNTPPVLRPIADSGVLVEFGNSIDDAVHQRVLVFDAAVARAEFPGVTELVPSYAAVFVGYDPLLTDIETLGESLLKLSESEQGSNADGTETKSSHWIIPACYSDRFAPDLGQLAKQVGLSKQAVAEQHCSGKYRVYMYGFAPGFAYMGGVPEMIHLPRKPEPVMNVAPGSLIIAGPQALITTVLMPSGWWNIGRAGKTPLQDDSDRPFLFAVGDTVEFEAVSETDFLAITAQG